MSNIDAQARLRQTGLKVTLPRIRVIEGMQASEVRHLTAEQLYRQLADDGANIGLATVYRVLSQLESVGLVVRHNLDSGADLFELAHGKHHDHMLCTTCGKVFEFTDAKIEARQQKVAEQNGLRLTGHAHYLYGECIDEQCANRPDEAPGE